MLVALLRDYGLVGVGSAFTDAAGIRRKLGSVLAGGETELAAERKVEGRQVILAFSQEGRNVAAVELEFDATTASLRTKAWRDTTEAAEDGVQ